MTVLLHTLIRFILYLYHYFFPLRCVVCENEMKYSVYRICSSCIKILPESRIFDLVSVDRCRKCGKKLIAEKNICMRCRKTDYLFISNYSLWDYSDESIKTLIHNYKFKKYREAAIYLSEQILKTYNKLFMEFIIVPIPCSRKRIREQGWDHMELIADYIEKTGIPVLKILEKEATEDQKQLGLKGRQQSVSKKIKIRKQFNCLSFSEFKGIVLIDDIFTTGSTVNECTYILNCAGVENIYIITLALD